jgi:hypothetical protein
VGTSITTAGSKTLLEATFGLIREVQVASTLRLPMGLDDLLRLLGERVLTVPPQDVQIRVLFKDGKELPISLTLAPVVNLEGTTLCDLQATGAALNLTRFESPLPDWIDATVARLINENQDARDQLRDALQTTLSNARPSFCR